MSDPASPSDLALVVRDRVVPREKRKVDTDEDGDEDTPGPALKTVKLEEPSDTDGDEYISSASNSASSSSDRKPSAKAKTRTKANAKGKGKRDAKPGPKGPARRWSGDDLEALFTAAMGPGPSMRQFEGKVAGRTPKQCQDTWNKTVLPYILKCLRERGDGKR